MIRSVPETLCTLIEHSVDLRIAEHPVKSLRSFRRSSADAMEQHYILGRGRLALVNPKEVREGEALDFGLALRFGCTFGAISRRCRAERAALVRARSYILRLACLLLTLQRQRVPEFS
jgi:hypothetical protein